MFHIFCCPKGKNSYFTSKEKFIQEQQKIAIRDVQTMAKP